MHSGWATGASLSRLVGITRFIVGIGTFTSIIMPALLFIAAAQVVTTIIYTVPELGLGGHETTLALTVIAVKHADTVLIAAALLIIGVGLYALFVGEVSSLPRWLEIETLDDLKDKLVSVIVAVLAVNFFTRVVEWEGGGDILFLGVAVSVVIIALAAYRSLHVTKKVDESAYGKDEKSG